MRIRRRVTPNFLLKAFITIFLFIFGVLILVTKLESEEVVKARHQEEKHRSNNKNQIAQGSQVARKGDEQNLQRPAPSNAVLKTEDVMVMKKGEIGNFEPKIVPKSGPGEMGKPIHVKASEKHLLEQSKNEYGFGVFVSDKIAMDRNIPDTRPRACQFWHYAEDLPTASVIFVFHNEGFSTLMRSVHSVINNSPHRYLKEVVMVDDFSSKSHLGKKLENYINEHWEESEVSVKLFRNSKREGLITARTLGAKYATQDVIIFLDAHIEVNRNWLVPLLSRIKKDRRTMAVPVVDGIDWDTFEVRPTYSPNDHMTGIFEWGFLYKETLLPKREEAKQVHATEPYSSPTHAGGLFAMDRDYFFEIGAYDPGLQIWGGENFELSFKIWQCGGRIEWVPCSHVAHCYRTHMPYGLGEVRSKVSLIEQNYMRVVHVWFEEKFQEYFYTRQPQLKGFTGFGDLSEQLKLKERLQCKNFEWFMDNVGYAVYEKFPPPPPNAQWGEIKMEKSNKCWDKGGGDTGMVVSLQHCHHSGYGQLFRLNEEGQLATGERCIVSNGNHLLVTTCPTKMSGEWAYKEKQIKSNSLSKCVEASGVDLKLVECDSSVAEQAFVFNEVFTYK